MNGNVYIWGGMFVGSAIGGMLPYLWNGGPYSYSIWSAVGGLFGIWAGFKLTQHLN